MYKKNNRIGAGSQIVIFESITLAREENVKVCVIRGLGFVDRDSGETTSSNVAWVRCLWQRLRLRNCRAVDFL